MSSNTMRRLVRRPTLIAGLLAALVGFNAAVAQQDVNEYVQFLEPRSMLFQAGQQSEAISGMGDQWRNDYFDREPQELVRRASVWVLYYPGSVIPEPGKSVIGTLGSTQLWDAFRDVGIEAIHTNPTLRAGGIRDREYTPTIDGWFDRISLEIDPQLGTEEDYRQMVQVAEERGGWVGGDLVPLHTGLGADFRLAERGYKDYPGMYTMVAIRQEDWGLLPNVDDPYGTALVSKEAAVELKNKGYIPGLINSADAHPDAKTWSGWSATPEVTDVDGNRRRSVYLHVFKPGQPALNWLDPSYAGRRAVQGDAVRHVHDLRNLFVRLDAVPFLGIEPNPDQPLTDYFDTPLAELGTEDIAMFLRKIGGWSFQELNVPMDQFKDFGTHGPDLGYDFFTRAECFHPVITQDARPCRLEHQLLLEKEIKHGELIHDLQNHDEITYQLVNLGSQGEIRLGGETTTGPQLKEKILQEMRAGVAGEAAPFNRLYRPEQDGVATTIAGFIAPALGVRDPYNATPDQVGQIQRAHILVAMANAMQPGVFAVSAWDLVGALPLREETVAERTADGDFRWINRGGVDLMGADPNAQTSAFGLPKAQTLYGPLPEQLGNPDSFASQLKTILRARKDNRIHESEVVAVPNVDNQAVVVLVMRLPDNGGLAVTALNYGRDSTSVNVDIGNVPGGGVSGPARDIVAGQDLGNVSGQMTIDLEGLAGRTVVIRQGQ
ncbi:trehalose synthase [Anaeromyxobacter sp. Fw109-5]|uniref:trehalose synthase n=1 Tax=Anaeromyxobacter sp. (strain Fw109-5) TaxID=404589 RepID=UPI0000ED89D9|nr:trehalose synthase [Anaeromyxobacter sp. Fw109-5]ABS27514.1 trehalose synthase [Anaeromyxobacter sp. Fw109-5]